MINSTQIVSDFWLEISKGDIPGVSKINKFGSNKNVENDVTEDVWDGEGVYPFPTSADITHIHQVSDQAAMRGQVVEVQGLDANWDAVIQSVTLDSNDTTTLVALSTPLIRVYRAKVLANVVASEDIDITNSTGTTLYARILAGNNQTLMAIYSVPRNVTAYMTNYCCNYVRDTVKDPVGIVFKLWVADRKNGYEFQLKHEKGIPSGAPGFQHLMLPYLKITEKSDIKITAKPDGSDAYVDAEFDLILVDN